MYVTIPLLYIKEMEEIQFQALLCAPAQPKGKTLLQKGEQRTHQCGRDPESHQEVVGSMLQDLPGSQFTEEKRKGNKVLSVSFKIGDNCSKPCYPEAESALDHCVQPQASQQGYIIMQSKKQFLPSFIQLYRQCSPKTREQSRPG